MPKYEYACKSCGERLEVVQTFADAPLSECPACAGPLRKVFSAPSIAFKGSGFYRTDNRKRRTEPSADTKPETKTDGSPDSKESKESKVPATADAKAEPAKKDKKESAPSADAKPKAVEAKTA